MPRQETHYVGRAIAGSCTLTLIYGGHENLTRSG